MAMTGPDQEKHARNIAGNACKKASRLTWPTNMANT